MLKRANPILKFSAELMGRYAAAIMVGLFYLAFYATFMSRFMSHLGMAGNVMIYDIGLLMLFEIPLWMLLVKLVGLWKSGTWIEILVAGILGVFAVQLMIYDEYFAKNFARETVDPQSKSEMLFWYVFTVTNYILTTHAAAFYCWIRSRFRKQFRPAPSESQLVINRPTAHG